jgi:hypothetical protein
VYRWLNGRASDSFQGGVRVQAQVNALYLNFFLSGGARVKAQANPLYLNLGSLYHQMKIFGIGSLQKMRQKTIEKNPPKHECARIVK